MFHIIYSCLFFHLMEDEKDFQATIFVKKVISLIQNRSSDQWMNVFLDILYWFISKKIKCSIGEKINFKQR